MNIVAEIRSRLGLVFAQVLAVFAVAYFGYHAIQGDRGLIAMMQLDEQVIAARQQLVESGARRSAFEHRVKLLRSENIDPDMLEERARYMLNYGFDDEVVIMEQPPTGPCFPLPRLP